MPGWRFVSRAHARGRKRRRFRRRGYRKKRKSYYKRARALVNKVAEKKSLEWTWLPTGTITTATVSDTFSANVYTKPVGFRYGVDIWNIPSGMAQDVSSSGRIGNRIFIRYFLMDLIVFVKTTEDVPAGQNWYNWKLGLVRSRSGILNGGDF